MNPWSQVTSVVRACCPRACSAARTSSASEALSSTHCWISSIVARDVSAASAATTNATLPVTLVMLEAIRDFLHVTGKKIGMKPAGGIATAKLALAYLVLLYETMGGEWMTNDLFRFGASSLLNDVLMQLRKEKTGAYQSGDYFTLD